MEKYKALLVFLISSLAIAGISFVDGTIWDVVFVIIGLIAYFLVGVLFTIGVLSGKQAGKDAYALFFALLTIGIYGIYRGLEKLRTWLVSLLLVAKIIIPSVITILIVVLVVVLIRKGRKANGNAS